MTQPASPVTPPAPGGPTFSLFGIPVQVSMSFWLVGTMLGLSAAELGVHYIAAWLVVLFVSILVHELGHAAVARAFGYRPRILLYEFGGLAMYTPAGEHTALRSVAISLAGPAAGFVLFGATWLARDSFWPQLASELSRAQLDFVWFVLAQLVWINLWWGLMNLLPVLPLDGGQICRSVCVQLSPRRGETYALHVGIVVGAAAALLLLTRGLMFAALLFALLAFSSLQRVRRPQFG